MQLQLYNRSSYTTPLSKQFVEKGQIVHLFGEEAERCYETGYFIEVPEGEKTEVSGISEMNPSFTKKIPEDWTDKRVLIINTGGIGDSIIASSLISYFKTKPCYVAFATDERSLPFLKMSNADDVFHVLSVSIDVKNTFDVVVDVCDFLKANENEICFQDYYKRCYKVAGIEAEPEMPVIHPQRLTEDVNKLFDRTKSTKYVAIHTTSSARHRDWYSDGWRSLVTALHDQGVACFALGVNKEGLSSGAIDCTHLSPSEQVSVLQKCHCFIGIDSAWLHIAGIMGKTVVGIFGPSLPANVMSMYQGFSVRSNVDCLGCRILRSKQCTNGYSCMMNIDAGQVYSKVYDALNPAVNALDKKLEIGKQIQESPKDVSYILKKHKIAVCFPYLWRGGGEIVTKTIAKGLKDFFDVRIVAYQLRPDPKHSIKEEIEASFDEIVYKEDDSADIFQDVDAVLWYGDNEYVPKALMEMGRSRPVSLRIVHTHYDSEGREFCEKWNQVIDKVICVSPVKQREIPNSVFIPNAVRDDIYAGEKTQFFESGKTIGFLGRFDDNKNIQWLIENLYDFDCNLLVQGLESDEIPLAFLQKIIKGTDIEKRVKFLPPNRDVGTFMKSIDALVVVSKQEGFPLVVIEAGNAGVPVISTKVGALPEFFEKEISFVDSQNGFPVIDQFREAVRKVKKSDGILLKRKVKEHCGVHSVALEYTKQIRSCLGKTFNKSFQTTGFTFFRREGAGDVIASMGVVNKVSQMFPKAPLHFATRKDLFDLVGMFFADCEVSEKNNEDYIEIPLDYTDCWEKEQHLVEGMGASIYDIPQIKYRKTDEVQKVVGFYATMNKLAENKTKEWKYWRHLYKKFQDNGYICGQLGHKEDKRIVGLNDLRVENIKDLFEVFKEVDYIIGIEGIAMHIAWALRKPIVVLVGGSTRGWLGSYPIHYNVVSSSECQCFGAVKKELIKPDCKQDCMDKIKVSDVLKTFKTYVDSQ